MAKYHDENINTDLGLGSRVAQQSRQRFLNKDGSFNVRRGGFPFVQSLNLYHDLLTMSWAKFYGLLLLGYLVANTVFAFWYVACGPSALQGADGITAPERFSDAFFFSVQTLSTIGYGHISPRSFSANVIVTIEAMTGLLGLAIATGLLFARFSRPNARIIFSRHAVIAPYRDSTAFEFRIVNMRSSELVDVNATVVFSRMEKEDGVLTRKFYQLALERRDVMFFPLHWVIVHPIDETSPLHGVDAKALTDSDAEFLVLLTATDETFSQPVHTRSSYKYNEVVWGAKFKDVFVPSVDGSLRIDMRKIHDYEAVDSVI